nr:hypothetical protein [Tanacetum cinerariifolium]
MTIVANENNELIPTRLVTGWGVCIDYRKLNDATRKDHFPLPFMDQMLERLAGNEFYCFLDGFSGYFQIPIDPQDQEKTTFTCPYGTFASQNSKSGIEVDRAKVEVIAKLPHPTTVKGVRSFLGHADFYLRFIQDFSKIARPMTHLLKKETPFVFSKECIYAFNTLKKKLTEAPILVDPDWNLPFELMCDASDYAIAVDYLFKWVEVKAFPTNDARVIVKFLKSLFSRFGTPRAIISDGGTHFCNDQFTRVMIKYGVTHRLATSYHPQTSGQVEAYETYVIYKKRTKKLHDSKIKNRIFNAGDQVLLFNSHLNIFSGKLKTRWSGPFTITRVFPYGTIELSQPNVPNFKVNGHCVKHYFGGDIPSNVAPDLHTFPMDN